MNCGAFAAIVKNDMILLVRSRTTPQYINHWSIPGGVVETDESLQAAAQREVLEETNIICQANELITAVDNIPSNIRVSIFKAQYISGELAIDETEIAEAGWFTYEKALRLPLAYNTAAIIRGLQ
jgi:ADP-ribose pyrophosphatase YjhB (NUDIX family)